MNGWLLGVIMLVAGLVALIAGGLLVMWWNDPRGPFEEQRPARSDTAPLLVTIGLLVAWIPWMVTAITLTVTGAVQTVEQTELFPGAAQTVTRRGEKSLRDRHPHAGVEIALQYPMVASGLIPVVTLGQ